MKKVKNAFKIEEIRIYIGIIILSVAAIFFNIKDMYPTATEALRHSAFQVSSIITTTGYSTFNFDLWPQFSKTLLVLLMMCGACVGSTGGGMKVSRIVLLFKSIIK